MPRGYGQFCPVAMACEVFAERWTPLVLRELCAGRSQFNDIHKGVPLMSRTLLAQRLRDLVDARVVTAEVKSGGRGQSYRLSTAGLALCPIIDQLGDWGTLFVRSRIGPASCDPSFLMWALRSSIDRRLLPESRFVVRFTFLGLEPAYRNLPLRWLVAAEGDLDVCWKDPGFDTDVEIHADITRFSRVWLGHEGLAAALSDGSVEIAGPREMVGLVRRLLDLRDAPAAKVFRFTPPELTGVQAVAGAA
ncbi:MAG TPA: helix-turn-helix domain-containing protein [Geminicoccaceae bacterium]|nr:helix-turn-helix domain-containing protein [Geminicoccus sp.]HMU49216.1 helix-turn-helix domain-containing protein [Geminicoccaceae bacterium]